MPDLFGQTRASRLLMAVFAVLVCAFLVAPALIVVPMSFSSSSLLEFPPRGFSLRWYATVWDSLTWMSSIRTSLLLATATAATSVSTGLLAAYARCKLPPTLSAGIGFVLLAPAFLPAILIGIGLFFLLARLGMVGSFAGLLLAHTALAVPVVIVIIGAGFERFDFAQERAARSLGAGWIRTMRTVIIPQISFQLATAALLAFLTSLDEVVVAMFIATGDLTTMTKVMFLSLRDRIDPSIAAVSTVLLLLVVIIVLTFVLRSSIHLERRQQ